MDDRPGMEVVLVKKLLLPFLLLCSSAMAQSLFFFKTEKAILHPESSSKNIFVIQDSSAQRQPQSFLESKESEEELRAYINRMFQKKKKSVQK